MILLLLACATPPTPRPPVSCASGTIADGDVCVPEACGTGTWGALDTTTVTAFVDASAEGGDGTADAPWSSIQAALDAAAEAGGGTIAVAAGNYAENLEAGDGYRDIRIEGRCAALCTVSGVGEDPTIRAIGDAKRPELTFSGLTVTGEYVGAWVEQATVSFVDVDFQENVAAGLSAADGAIVSLDRVRITDTSPDRATGYGYGLNVDSATVTVTDSQIDGNARVGLNVIAGDVQIAGSSISGTLPGRAGTEGHGMELEQGGSVTGDSLVLDGNRSAGIHLRGGSTLTLTESSISGTLPDESDSGGFGIQAVDGSRVELTGVTLDGNQGGALVVQGEGTSATISGTTIEHTVLHEGAGFGLDAEGGATVTATTCTLLENAVNGVYAAGAGTAVTFSDSIISGTAPNADGERGEGVVAEDGAMVTLSGCVVDGNTEGGVVALGAEVWMSGTTVTDTHPLATGTDGAGLLVTGGGYGNVESSQLTGNTGAGVYVSGAGTSLDLFDTTISGTLQGEAGDGGYGVDVGDGAVLTASGLVLEGNVGAGLYVDGEGTSATVTDTTIIGGVSFADGTAGRGVAVQRAASFSGTGLTIADNVEVGFYVASEGTTVSVEDSSVSGTVPRADGAAGYGVEVDAGATATFLRCEVDQNHSVGARATGSGSSLTLSDSVVTGTLAAGVAAFGLGLSAEAGASLAAIDTTVQQNAGPGLYAADEGVIACTRCDIDANAFAGAAALDGSLLLDHSAVTDTAPDAEYGATFGVYANDVYGAPSVTVTDSTLGPAGYAAVWLDGNGSYDIERTTISGSAGVVKSGLTLHGNAVFAENGVTAWDGTTGLLLADDIVSGSSAEAVLLDGSSATLTDLTWSGNATDVWQQRCDGVSLLTDLDLVGAVAVLCPTGNLLTAYDLQLTTLYLPSVTTSE